MWLSDTLVVRKLNRLARSLRQLIGTVDRRSTRRSAEVYLKYEVSPHSLSRHRFRQGLMRLKVQARYFERRSQRLCCY